MNDIQPALTGMNAVETRAKAVEARANLTRQRAELERQQAEAKADLERQRKELEAVFAAKRAELEAQMAPLKAELAKMVEVLWTVDLYLGRDETLRLLRGGTPAPADAPITVRQRVLVMAEESLVLMGHRSTGMDADNIPEFVNWLLEDDAHLDQVLPEPKGVVVLIPTKIESRSGNVFEDAHRNAANKQAFWLIRNGQRLYLLTTDPKLVVVDRVLPRRNEFMEVFDRRLFGFDGVKIGEPAVPGSQEWLELEKYANALQRHYMRIILVLQGLIDRTPVWHPLPEGGASFLRLEDQDLGKIRLIQDGDDSLQLTDGREDFTTWQRKLNARLRPGMRIVGAFHSEGWLDKRSRDFDGRISYEHERVHPPKASYPPSGEPLLLEGRKDGGLVVRYQRTDEVWRTVEEPVPGRPGYVYRTEQLTAPKTRASAVIRTEDDWILAYDLATVEDLTYYLGSRENRSKHFLSMVPVLRAALEAKQAEFEAEADFRAWCVRSIVAEGHDEVEATRLVSELVHWWKTANTWARPLRGDGPHEVKAMRAIVAEFERRTDDSDTKLRQAAIQIGEQTPGALAVACVRTGAWFLYTQSTPAHESRVFVDVTPIRADGTLGSTKTEQLPTQRTISNLEVAWSAPEWDTWLFGANRRHWLTQAERDDVIAQMRELAADKMPLAVIEHHDPKRAPGERRVAIYFWAGKQPPQEMDAKAVTDPYSYHSREGLIGCIARKVVKDSDGVQLISSGFSTYIRPDFSCYAGGSRWGDTPWWPDDRETYSYEERPRLIWADEDALDAISDYRIRCRDAWKAREAKKQELERSAYRYSRPVEKLIRDRQVAAIRVRFDEDYGVESVDLWPAHLKSLDLMAPIHPRDLWGLVAIAQDHGNPVVGQSLGQLADFAWSKNNRAPGEWHPGRGRMDLKGYGDIIVPEPEDHTPSDS